ncbi:MAG: hypothetical protein DWQ31_15535 [Planctomycetota bacterium]|nr:MAG: hypothetical protein DWQ31_15535 [Planctomycetota bacterium]REJ89982.1 MAG: hypothetical protein DWQ35_17340 [Planctomycetota bacterium]
MTDSRLATEQGHRVWIVQVDNWQPRAWSETPPRATTVEVAIDGCVSAEDAALFVEGFNRRMLAERRDLWAVIVPVKTRYQGDLLPGQHCDDTSYYTTPDALT